MVTNLERRVAGTDRGPEHRGPGARGPRTFAARYGVAGAAVVLTVAVRLLLDPFFGAESPFLLFAVAIMVGAWLGGLGPGLFATALVLVTGNYLFLDPFYSFTIDGPGRLLDLALFGAVGAGISVLAALTRAARLRSATSEERFRLLVQGAKDYAILMLSPDGRVTSWNEGAGRILGYREDEILGEHFSVFFTPEDRREGRPARELELAIGGGGVSGETWAVRKDGTRLWANGSTDAVRDAEGNLKGVVKVLRDRTEAKHAEEQLRLKDRAISASANGIVITDPGAPDNPIVYANPAFEEMTGYSAEEAIGRNCRFLQGEDRDQPALEELRAAVREGRSCEVVLRNYKKDGALFFNELSVSPVFDDGGRAIRFVGIQNDITEKRRIEQALRVQAEASELLATPLAYEERLVSLARLVVPRMADWCAVDVVAEDGSVRRLAVEHEDPEKVALAYELGRRYPADPDAPRGMRHVLKTGEPEIMREIPDELLRETVRDDRQLGMLRELGLRSYMIVPMVARGRTLGAITLVSAESGMRYGPEDLEQAETLVRRAAMAVDNARLYEEARREISAREKAQEELRRSEDRLRLATESTGLGTFDYSPVTGELLWDARSKEIFGLPPDAGVDYETFLAGLHPDDRERTDREIQRALEPAGGGEFGIGYRVVGLGDGEERWVDARGRVFFEGGRAVRFIGTVLDVTEERRAEEALKRSEERYRAVIEQSTEGIFLLDAKTRRVLETNPAFGRMLGYTAEELRAMEFSDLVDHSREDLDANVGLTLEAGRRLVGGQRYRRKDGTYLEVEVGASTISYDGHKAICATVRDVTERKRTERALAEMREAERGRIARELHDGVLQDLSYTAQTLEVTRLKYEGTGVEMDLEEGAEAIRRAARDLREAIYDLRAYRHGTQDPRQLFEALVDLNRRRMPGLDLSTAFEDGLLEQLSERGVAELSRIVQEALTNVRRHSGATKVSVTVSSRDDALVAEVSDDGRGFDPEALPPGIGTLGMRERAVGLGGRLEVESEPGAGTTVRFAASLENLS